MPGFWQILFALLLATLASAVAFTVVLALLCIIDNCCTKRGGGAQSQSDTDTVPEEECGLTLEEIIILHPPHLRPVLSQGAPAGAPESPGEDQCSGPELS